MASIAEGTVRIQSERGHRVIEDATLRRELDGWAEYARRVRLRLVPGAR